MDSIIDQPGSKKEEKERKGWGKRHLDGAWSWRGNAGLAASVSLARVPEPPPLSPRLGSTESPKDKSGAQG